MGTLLDISNQVLDILFVYYGVYNMILVPYYIYLGHYHILVSVCGIAKYSINDTRFRFITEDCFSTDLYITKSFS